MKEMVLINNSPSSELMAHKKKLEKRMNERRREERNRQRCNTTIPAFVAVQTHLPEWRCLLLGFCFKLN
ncbi:hypothetical protein VNO78_18360 [Psophocarpus tetragonolobus]|uniref:Uncharacterized protein n=1 Tax=Psophocarpus tetragonolobus TaxID=3891 RepID=A0AAN9SPC9_PSOTE